MGWMTNEEMETLKAALLKDMAGEIDALVAERGASGALTLTQIEDVVLEARQRIGQKLAERLIEVQTRTGETRMREMPLSPVTGKRLHLKGKKTKH